MEPQPRRVQGSTFMLHGIEANFRLGGPGVGLHESFVGSADLYANVSGSIDIPAAFLFAGAETYLLINAIVGPKPVHGSRSSSVVPAICFRTNREGSVGGSWTLEVNAALGAFLLEDKSDLGGLGKKRIVVNYPITKRLHVTVTGRSNFANYQLVINGPNDREMTIASDNGPPLYIRSSEVGDTLFVHVSD